MNPNYQEKAIPLISVDQNTGKYLLSEEGKNFIKSIPGPIGVVSVAGLYRTGKSYLLNRMILNRNNGFGVGPTVNPCTKGLWCWGTPIKGQSADGQRLNIIVIDTQGIGALDQDQTHDTRIFTLAILASSCFIYNSTGSIDENAVQNLSLVVNLTKHIQLSTDNKNEDQDPDKIANYFPKFFWVVRDFSLQMVDTEGNQISSREYLQKALAPQKGVSDDVEQKNRIRRILTSFFKQRQCITLVRPLIDETKLQQLDGLEFDHLRPEFVKKVMQLRRNITNKMKPKTINNQKLNGNLYWSMLTSYVGAINDGAVPNIENAWHYMCQQQCTKIVNQSYDVFEKMIKDIKIPCSMEQIEKDLQKAHEAAVEHFKKESIGERADQFYRELIKRMKDRVNKIKSVNAEQGKMSFKKYLNPFMNAISQKINKQQYENIEEFIEQIKKLEDKINKEQPKFVDWRLFLQMSIKRMLQQGSIHLMKRARNQKEQFKKSSEEKLKLNEMELEKLKKQNDGDHNNLMDQIKKIEKEKVQFKYKVQCLESQIAVTVKQKTQEIERLTKKFQAKKKEAEQKDSELDTKTTAAHSKISQIQMQLQTKQNQWEKQKAVMKKQLQHNQQLIIQLQKKKQHTQTKYQVERSQISKRFGEQLMNERQKNQILNNQVARFKDTSEQLTKKVSDLTEDYQQVSRKLESEEKKYREDLTIKTKQIQKLQYERQFEMSKIRNQYEQEKDNADKNTRQNEEKLKRNQVKIKQLKNDLTNENTKLKHQIAILQQQFSQIQIQNEDNKAKIVEMKRSYEAERQAWETDRGMYQQQEIAKKINDLQAQHIAELQTLRLEQQKQSDRSEAKISQLVTINNEYELNNKLLKDKVSTQERDFNEIQQKKLTEIDNLQKLIKNMERQHKTTLLSRQNQFKSKFDMKQRQLEDERENHEFDKNEFQGNWKKEIITLKNLHEIEKQKLQSKLHEDKQKLKKQIKTITEKYQQTLEEERQSREEELQQIQSRHYHQTYSLQECVDSLKLQVQKLLKQKSLVEQKLAIIEQKYIKIETQLQEKLQKAQQALKTERISYNSRLEQLQDEKIRFEKELLSANHIKNQLANNNQKLAGEIDELKVQNSKIKQIYENHRNQSDSQIKQLKQKHMQLNSEKDTEIALLSQVKRFSQEKIKQLEQQIDKVRLQYQNNSKKDKQSYESQKKKLEEKVMIDKKLYDERIQKLRKTNQQLQANLSKKTTDYEKGMAILQEKIKNLEENMAESENSYNATVTKLKQELSREKESFIRQRSTNKEIVMNLEEKLASKQNEYNQIKNALQLNDKLAKNEIKNLNQKLQRQKIQCKEKIFSLQRSLTDQKLQSRSDKQNQQSNKRQVLKLFENKYLQEIKGLKEQIRGRTKQNQDSKKQYDISMKQLNEKYAFLNQDKQQLEKQFKRLKQDSYEREKNHQRTMQLLRSQMQLKEGEFKQQVQRVTNSYKLRLQQTDRRCKVLQEQRTSIYLEKEKEGAKWNIEKVHYEQKITDLKDEVERVAREQKKLVKDNEKMKAEKKKNTSQIRTDRTFIYARDIPNQNKENTSQQ